MNRTSCPELFRSIDWSTTALGPADAWPRSLKSYVSMVMEMPTPAIVFWGPDELQIYNDAYAVIMGPRHPRYFGAPYRDCWPDTYPVIHPWMRKVRERGETVEVDKALFMLTRHGFNEEAHFTFTFSPLRDDDGAIAGIFQPVLEVTDAVLTERRSQTLRALESQGSFDALAGNDHDVPFALHYAWDADARRLALVAGVRAAAFDPAALALAGDALQSVFESGEPARIADVAALLGPGAPSRWPEPTRAAIALAVRRAASESPSGVVLLGISPCLSFDAAYVDFFDAIARQLATLRHAEEAQRSEREQSARLQSIFAQAPVAITILRGPRYVIDLANPLIARIWGRPQEQLLGQELFAALPELAGQGLEELLGGVRQSGVSYVGTELPIKIARLAGRALDEVYFNFVYEPLRDANGAVEGVIVVAADVTAQVNARRHGERLAGELRASQRVAEAAREAAESANRAKDEFVAMLGHELRNPLAPILTALDLLRLRPGAAAIGRETAIIERQARHMTRLVDDLLDVARIARGTVELKRERVELAEIIATALETVSPLLEALHHAPITRVPAAGLLIDGDPARLVQVFANLLSNAAKYTQAGGTIIIAGERDGDEIIASVSDNGRGISAEMLPRVFDLFVQERQNIARSEGGLGLGLAIVKNIVELHGGHIDVASAGRHRGSVFTVRLAAAPDTAEVPAPSAPLELRAAPTAEGQPRPHLLVVDDNEDAAELLADALELLGYSVRVAHDGRDALAIAEQARFDAVLLDIGLPVMDGYEVARRLRTLPGWRTTPLIAVTGYGQESDKQRSREAGFDQHLVKPVDVRALEGCLHALRRERA